MWNWRYSTAGEVKVNQNKIAIVVNSSCSCVWGARVRACARQRLLSLSYLQRWYTVLYRHSTAHNCSVGPRSSVTSCTINTTALLLVRTSARHNLDLISLEARRIWCFNQINNLLTHVKLGSLTRWKKGTSQCTTPITTLFLNERDDLPSGRTSETTVQNINDKVPTTCCCALAYKRSTKVRLGQ